MRRTMYGRMPAMICVSFITFIPAQPARCAINADSLFSMAREAIADSAAGRALDLLDEMLEAEPEHYPALIERGRLYLRLGQSTEARSDFGRALGSRDPETRARAYIGLGDILRTRRFRNLQALAEYRLALDASPDNPEALYKVAETGFELRQTHGYRVAGKALARLLCIDPGYRDAYRLWREEILDQSNDELREAGGCLDRWLAGRPDSVSWRLELARDRFRLGEPDVALIRLADLDSSGAAGKGAERKLLEARCRLELGDETGFGRCYEQALELAASEGDFERLMLEAETIFSPEEIARWDSLETSAERAEFFRGFWAGRAPDPLDESNERLLEHYHRLNYAQRIYRMKNPHSLFQTSRDYHHLLSPIASHYEVDPDLFYGRNRRMVLDQRGLVYVRHGPPDRYTHQVTWQDPMEIWYYGNVHFLFEQKAGVGDFIYVPSITRGAGDIVQAMATDSYRDTLPLLEPEFYAAEFMASGDSVEIEFYLSVPDSAAGGLDSLGARLGIYDSTWLELARDSSSGAHVGRDWLAVNRVRAPKGGYRFALSLAVPGRRAVVKGEIELDRFKAGALALSGMVLGAPVQAGAGIHSRMGVPLLPRPSKRFVRGETVAVYLEIYGLKEDYREQARHWRQRVAVSRTGGGGSGGLFKRLGRLFGLGGDERTRLTLAFDRRVDSLTGPAAEQFTVDTSNLAPGAYRLVVEVQDNSDGRRAASQFEFEITEKN